MNISVHSEQKEKGVTVGAMEDHYAKIDEDRRNNELRRNVQQYNYLVSILGEAYPLLAARTRSTRTAPADHKTVLVDASTKRYEIAWPYYLSRGRYYFFLQSAEAVSYTPTHESRGQEATRLIVRRISIENTVGAFEHVADGTENAVLNMQFLEELVDGLVEACHTFGVKYKKRWYREGNALPLYSILRKGFWAS